MTYQIKSNYLKNIHILSNLISIDNDYTPFWATFFTFLFYNNSHFHRSRGIGLTYDMFFMIALVFFIK